MSLKIKARCRMKIAWQDRDVLLSIGRMWDSFEIDGKMQDLNRK